MIFFSHKNRKYIEKLKNKFPDSHREDIKVIENKLDLSSEHQAYMPFEVLLNKKTLYIPARIYTAESQLDKLKKLTPTQKEITYCLYSRHHNGFVRERCLKEFIASNNTFTTPYIIQLLGEYVIEIIEIIYQNREKINKNNLVTYILENPKHYEKTRQRVYSYWDCYYRKKYPKYQNGVKYEGETYLDYPGIKMIKHINKILSMHQQSI